MKNSTKKRIAAAVLAIVICAGIATPFVFSGAFNTKKEPPSYPAVFVHGLYGWGAEPGINNLVTYWGNINGNMIVALNNEGHESYNATVGPVSSAWDRACELYAQLTGTRVDYGEAHSEACGHSRYGRTYETPLFENWSEEKKINLFGHSFGGATIRLFLSILEGGAAEEATASPEDVSPFFEGGKGEMVHSITTLAAPHNGTTLIYAFNDLMPLVKLITTAGSGIVGNTPMRGLYDFSLDHFGITQNPSEKFHLDFNSSSFKAFLYGNDNAYYDLSLHGAAELNKKIVKVSGVYYFSYANGQTESSSLTGNQVPQKNMLLILKPFSLAIGAYRENKVNDYEIDENWLQNDGLVNTISAKYPFSEPHTDFDEENIKPGIWNVMPVYDLDHAGFITDVDGTGFEGLLKFYDTQLDRLKVLA